MLCCALVVVWAASGPIFGFSDTWQLVINTGTTVVTFLMVFVIQNTQNREGAALQAKLDELIRASAAQNAFIGIEHLTEEELDEIRKECEERASDRGRDLTKQERALAAADVAERRVRPESRGRALQAVREGRLSRLSPRRQKRDCYHFP